METKNKLDPEFKAKWIATLRSGEYKQGRGHLYNHTDNTYCCLGVACRVAGHEPIKDSNELEYPSRSLSNIPKILTGFNTVTRELAFLNDGNGDSCANSFSEIADYIEKNL